MMVLTRDVVSRWEVRFLVFEVCEEGSKPTKCLARITAPTLSDALEIAKISVPGIEHMAAEIDSFTYANWLGFGSVGDEIEIIIIDDPHGLHVKADKGGP